MRKFLSIILSIIILFSSSTVYAQEFHYKKLAKYIYQRIENYQEFNNDFYMRWFILWGVYIHLQEKDNATKI